MNSVIVHTFALGLTLGLVTTPVTAGPERGPAVLTLAQVGAPGLSPMQANVARQLPALGFRNVDVRQLSTVQLAQINHLLHSDRSVGDVRRLVAGTLRRGPLQRAVTRVLQ
ncbi:hypothetical protein JANAI62_14310 [Jannaschia pagri]|uniref:Uncharacterized protein n=1 Tax=Jannaschia pagri TaxID=2829797 RepID=A0ABQ4NK75_9RHOB|nr:MULTISPECIES: hypothetical protein [unclassified Jannaschia]GIT90976.1 hypothetical protein JANAI61_14340 [Jannaschia sp. AI_61]GIT94808.1 hypothetical protein JANAI62_14310 [Jannaschia sp. AI_62]